jgi:hypothetical protein
MMCIILYICLCSNIIVLSAMCRCLFVYARVKAMEHEGTGALGLYAIRISYIRIICPRRYAIYTLLFDIMCLIFLNNLVKGLVCALDNGENFQCPQGVSQNRNIHNIAMEFLMKATEKSRAKAKAC